jgi:hypothetical protein
MEKVQINQEKINWALKTAEFKNSKHIRFLETAK